MKHVVGLLLLFCVTLTNSVFAQNFAIQKGLSLKYIVSVPAKSATRSGMVILLHGYGSNEQDMMGLRAALPQDIIVVSARAPYPLGGDHYQWFEKEIVNGKYSGRNNDLTHSRKLITAFIDEVVKKYDADPAKVLLAGFSQGAMMSLETGLTVPGKLCGIGVFSGRLPESLKPLVKKGDALNRLRIFISHGTADSRLPYEDGKAVNEYLIGMGLKPEFHAYKGMDHTISKEVMHDFVRWINR